MEFQSLRSAEMSSDTSLEGIGDNSRDLNIETLSAENVGVHRLSARAQEYESDT
jgi:hypothetical protein